MQLSIKIEGLEKLRASLNDPKQVKFAAMQSINKVAFLASDATKKAMRDSFDRPTPWVLGGVRYKKATRENLTAVVDLDFWGNKQGVAVEQVLKAEIFGGSRSMKRHEVALARAGVLPEGMRIVPGSAAAIDSYGNMVSGQINQIISWFKAFGEQGYQANMGDKRRKSLGRDKKKSGARGFAYFVLRKPRGRLPAGVYQRFQSAFGSAVKPVMIFVPRVSYKKRLDFYGIAQRTVDRNLQREFDIALENALRTAR